MSRKLKMLGIGMLVVALAIAASFITYVSDAGAQSSQTEHGPWMVAGDGTGGGYLVNTTTGETWRLRDDAKLPLREWKPEPGK